MSVTGPAGRTANLVRVLLLALLVLAVFSGTVFLVASLLAWWYGSAVLAPWNLVLGILCGLIVWLFVAIFHIKAETIHVPVQRRGGFLDAITVLLQELGYQLQPTGAGQLLGRPGFRSYLMGGAIQVELEGAAARLTGPKVYVEILRRRVRMLNVVGKARQDATESQRRQGEKLLKRVAITMRVPLEQWDEVYDEVIDVLLKEDAEVVCELNVLASSAPGIRDTTVETMIRDWLRQRQIEAQVHKESRQDSSARLPVLPGVGTGLSRPHFKEGAVLPVPPEPAG